MKEELAKIATRHQLSAIYVFGSRSAEVAARISGNRCPAEPLPSDIDIGVLPHIGMKMQPKEKVSLTIALEELLKAKRVDLVVLPEVDPFLAAEVIKGERIYCENEDAADEYELYVLRRAGDLMPLEKERIRLILGEQG